MQSIFFNRFMCRLILPVIFALSAGLTANAATFEVTKIADTNDGICNTDCSLREAIAAANAASSDDIIEFRGPIFTGAQTIVLGGAALEVENNGSLTINGTGANSLAISANGLSRVFFFQGATVTLNSVTVKDGKLAGGDGAGIFNNLGTIIINNSTIIDNFANEPGVPSSGGGIFNRGTMTVNNSIIRHNIATTEGGGIANGGGGSPKGAVLHINNSTFDTNSSALHGGAVSNYFDNTLTIADSTFDLNSATNGSGGAIFNLADADLDNITVTQQSAANGGGIYNGNRAHMTLTDSSISNNTTSGNGAGIFGAGDFGSTLTITNSQIFNNFANGFGAGILGSFGTINVTDSRIRDNFALNGGGGIYFTGSGNTLTVTRSEIKNNQGSTSGGGLFLDGATANFIDSTVYANTANGGGGEGGGGVFVGGGIFNATNVTVTGNSTAKQGGGIMNRSGTTNLSNVTVNGNTGTAGAGGIFNFNSRIVRARNTIIGDNTCPNLCTTRDFSGTLTSQGYNLIENTSGATITGTTTGNILGQDPKLMPIANYSGTGFVATVALRQTSPAIDGGDPVTFTAADQRGIPRPQDGDLNGSPLPDIGAYERKVITVTVNKVLDTNDGVCDSDCSLREAIGTAFSQSNANPDQAVIFDPSFSLGQQTIVLTNGQLNIANPGTISIFGPGANLLTVSGNDATRVFMINSGSSALIRDLTVSGGNDTAASGANGGGGIRIEGFLDLLYSSVVDNRSVNFSGGIYPRAGGTVFIDNCFIARNMAGSGGGAIYINNGSVDVANTIFDHNTSNLDGGAIVNGLGTLTARNITVSNNTAARSGGGLDLSDTTVIADSRIINNLSAASFGNGGGISADDSLTITNTTISGNKAKTGGGIAIAGAGENFNISGSTISDNIAVSNAGGIRNSSANLNLTNSTVSGNSTETSSSTDGFGGGLSIEGGTSTLTHVTIVNNISLSGGSGIFRFGTSGAVNIRNSILANNSLGSDFNGTFTSQGYNLIESTTGTTITGTTTGNITGQDPNLGPLTNNGGATQTFSLLTGSPAIDSADPNNILPTDQRGFVRPRDGDRNGTILPDIGAFEKQFAKTVPYDFDGDGKADVSLFRPSEGNWYLLQSTAGFLGFHFGASADKIAPADYDGDGKTDFGVFRPSENTWYIQNSTTGFTAANFGIAEDIPQSGDFDGDGKAEIALWRPSEGNWYTMNLATGETTGFHFGTSGDKPVVGDYDGDGKMDYAVYRPSEGNWYLMKSTEGFSAFHFGVAEDMPVPADFDGDGKTDFGVFRPSEGNWYLMKSTEGYTAFHWGLPTDLPAPADYDGDGKADIAVFRDGQWYLQQSAAGYTVVNFGLAGDKPAPNAFVY
jgi:CSLREA domain-containing protein